MRGIFVLIILAHFYTLASCQDKNKTKDVRIIEIKSKEIQISKIDSSEIGQEIIVNKDDLVNLFCKSYEKDYSVVDFDWNLFKESTDVAKISIKKYVDLKIDNNIYSSYLFSFKSENDNIYTSLLLANNALTDGIIIYEYFQNEAKIIRKSSFQNNKLSVESSFIYNPNSEFLEKEEQIKIAYDTILLVNNSYLIQYNHFVDFFKQENGEIDRTWKDRDNFYSYRLKGKIKNHLKEGYWKENVYILEYGTKPTSTFGKYIKGLKEGEWAYSTDDFKTIDRVDLYKQGKLQKRYKSREIKNKQEIKNLYEHY